MSHLTFSEPCHCPYSLHRVSSGPSEPQREQLAAVTAIITTEMQSVMIAVCSAPGCLLRNINRCEFPVSHPSSPGARAAPANEGQIGENQFNETRAVSSKTGSEPALARVPGRHGARTPRCLPSV